MFFEKKLLRKKDAAEFTDRIAEGKNGYYARLAECLIYGDGKAFNFAAEYFCGVLSGADMRSKLRVYKYLRDASYTYYVPFEYARGLSDIIKEFPIGRAAECLFVFSASRDGYLREKAFKQMRNYDNTLPYALIGAGDWVPQVRAAAAAVIRSKLGDSSHNELSDMIIVMDYLKNKERTDSAVIRIVKDYVDKNQYFLVSGLNHSHRSVRNYCGLALASDRENTEILLSFLAKEKDPYIRYNVYLKLMRTAPNAARIVEMIKKDRNYKIRGLLLDYIRNGGENIPSGLPERLLLDSNGGIRESAVFYVRRLDSRFSAENFYRDQLKAGNVFAIGGVAAYGNKEDACLIEKYLVSDFADVAAAAVNAVMRLDREKYTEKVTTMLEHPSPRVAKQAYIQIKKQNNLGEPELIERLYRTSVNGRARFYCAKLLFASGKWSSLIFMLEAIVAGNEFGELAANRLENWFRVTNRSFILPSPRQRERILDLTLRLKDENLKKRIMGII